jgi:RNA polymerase sigma-70 factor (ECF subfamily)
MPEASNTALEREAHRFPATHWSVVTQAGGPTKAAGVEAALARLCQTYWYPLYAFVRRHGFGPEEAQDLTQGFFADLLARHALAQADPARGLFRSFLLASLRHFLAKERARAAAQKRGGGRAVISLDTTQAETRFRLEAADDASPDMLFERNWALALLEHVLARLRAEQDAAGKGEQFEQMRDCLMGDPAAPRYAELAAKLGASADAVKMSVCRLRRRYGELLRDELACTVNGPAEVEAEIRHLFTVLGG